MRNNTCAQCGMLTSAPNYHPFAACLMFQACRNSLTVEANLRAVVEYGMKAQRQGLTIEEAMTRLDLLIAARATEERDE